MTPSRAQTYQAQYRKGGRTRRVSIGRHGKITVDEARKLAKEVMGQVAKGENPAEDRIGKARGKYRLT
ncbi:Arm DNA-binding domain-containing protein [Parasedimentitalea psychrophila]|uniref:Arm DNA-binding domain-containing protein n=1 Tax=Parasedimentitalea psychrophila TaxID=2997337 RepID=A0A9Y2KXS4_9RHOB|nr:Arm DNA-binding domain-containing protein [Parasedimentitalea psychrophila]WIY24429.1 Arm DNA-binding domain-containing protein [Parasedimentitalea psychrophila]